MGFRWTYLDADGQAVGRSDPFADRDGAEEWLGHAWQELLARGVEEVALVDQERGDRVLYQMGLREA